MPPAAWIQAGLQEQRDKLANSYQELLDEFNSKDLRTVGNYTVGRLIGKGSFGKVYLASHKLTNGSKVVLKSAKKDDQNLAREIHHHRQFVHPHIARLYEVIVTENLVWLVLEYCPGDELYNHLLQHGRMEESHVQRIFTQLVGAVSYVHVKGCVHRDLKLENILLDKNGNVKLVDFGFTREYQGSTSYLQTWCGTVCYSAPEMIKGERYAGEKVDVWSLGIILFALLRGELPWDDDDEALTKSRILKEDPVYTDDFPAGARDLCQKLLSKRPLPRPSLPDILRHPWLSEHAPQQQEILKLQQPAPFSTQLEKEVLDRMRSAGVDIDLVIEHVLAQRCDGLAGWWALLSEKEERKARRKERRRREKELEEKRLKRLSAASGRLLTAPSLREINEDEQMTMLMGSPPKPRGRKASRSNASSLPPHTPDLGQIKEHQTPTPEPREKTRQYDKDPQRSTSSTRRRPDPPPKETVQRPTAVTRHSSNMMRNVQQNSELLGVPQANPNRKRLYQQPFRAQLTRIKSWFVDMPKRRTSPVMERKNTNIQDDPHSELRRASTAKVLEIRKASNAQLHRPEVPTRATYPTRPRLSTTSSHGSQGSSMTRAQAKRLSLSPQPLTPRSSYKRRSGMGGRKSTSSSVSSVRSIAIHHPSVISHSKTSSTSSASNSIASPKLGHPRKSSLSPNPSVTIQPPPPQPGQSLPTSIRIQRVAPGSLGPLGPLPTFSDVEQQGALRSTGAFNAIGPPSPGMHAVFARGKRKVFKGPTGLGNSPRNTSRVPTPSGSGAGGLPSRDTSQARASMEEKIVIMEEEEDEEDDHTTASQLKEFRDAQTAAHTTLSAYTFEPSPRFVDFPVEEEDEEEDMDVEEVDAFSPISEGMVAEIRHENGELDYFASVHKPEIFKGVQHDRQCSYTTTNGLLDVHVHDEDSPILRQGQHGGVVNGHDGMGARPGAERTDT